MNNLIISILIGIAAGWLAGVIRSGRGFGVLGNLIVGVLGSILGGVVFGMLGIGVNNLIGVIIQATIGALLLLFLLGLVEGKKK